MMLPLFAFIFGGVWLLFPKQVEQGAKTVFGPFLNFGPPTQAMIDFHAKSLAKSRLIQSEGKRNDVYKDTLGYLTVGIGHKVLPQDNLSLGQRISDAQIDAFFEQDVATAFEAAKQQALDLNKYNADFIAALTEVNFQLGTGWRYTFRNTYDDLRKGNVASAINRLEGSTWRKQTPQRVAAFIEAIERAYT